MIKIQSIVFLKLNTTTKNLGENGAFNTISVIKDEQTMA